jgi:hypothetical protein
MTANAFSELHPLRAEQTLARDFQPGIYFSIFKTADRFLQQSLNFPTIVGIERKFLIDAKFQKKLKKLRTER